MSTLTFKRHAVKVSELKTFQFRNKKQKRNSDLFLFSLFAVKKRLQRCCSKEKFVNLSIKRGSEVNMSMINVHKVLMQILSKWFSKINRVMCGCLWI